MLNYLYLFYSCTLCYKSTLNCIVIKRTILIVAEAPISPFGYAQDGYNPLSVRPVHTSDVMHLKTVTRVLDLREKCNERLFARNKEITTLIIDGVTNGFVNAYVNDSLNTQLSLTDFFKKMQSPAVATLSSDTVDLFLEYGESCRQMVEFIKA